MSKPVERRLKGLEGTPTDFVSVGSSKVLNQNDHAGKVMLLDTAAGSTVTLPPATGSGLKYEFLVKTLATSNSHKIQVANASDAMQGYILSKDDTADAVVGFFATAGTSDTITLNRTTTGSVTIGEKIVIQDIAANRYQVEGVISNSGTPATPFSNAVS